jgi:molybdopterin/thiamine biosynthesis adenylyltransferase
MSNIVDNFLSKEKGARLAKIRIKENDWKVIKNILERSFSSSKINIEWGLIGILKKVGACSYIITEVVQPNRRNDVDQKKGGLSFSANYIRRVQLQARKEHCTGLIFFHTHPFSENEVDFSFYDNTEEPSLIENLRSIWPDSEHASVVVGKRSMAGRIYSKDNLTLTISNVSVLGKAIKFLLGEDVISEHASPEHIFDRATTITGKGALSILRKMKIAVIGCGGIGSLMIELLCRAGCQNITLIDDDYVDETNLNRLLHASVLDAREKRKKVYIAVQAANSLGMGHNLEIIEKDVVDNTVQEKLKDMDLLVGCVDKDAPRYILNKISVEAYIPYLDLGTEIGIGNNKLLSLDARVTYVFPGGPCLMCRGLINHERIRLEGLSLDERKRHIGMGYCEDIDIKQPAVMELNMRAASLASLLIRNLIQPFFDLSLEMDLRESILTFSHRQLKSKPQKIQPCLECGYQN